MFSHCLKKADFTCKDVTQKRGSWRALFPLEKLVCSGSLRPFEGLSFAHIWGSGAWWFRAHGHLVLALTIIAGPWASYLNSLSLKSSSNKCK